MVLPPRRQESRRETVSVDGTEISDASSLTALIESHSVGDTISVSVLRNGQTLTLSVTLGEQTASSN